MPSLFYDPTEARSTSRLPDNVIVAGVPVPKLESLTGTDLLISPLGNSLPDLDSRAGRTSLRLHSQAGILVQRKSGMDFISSVSRLSEIECRMLEWGLPWLLVTGSFGCDRKGTCYVDGRRARMSYQQMVSALDMWQLRGGGVTVLRSDGHISKWIELMTARLGKVSLEPVKVAERAKQALTKASRDDPVEKAVHVLRGFDGIGDKMARDIVRECGTLGKSLVFLSGGEGKVKGVGKVTLDRAKDTIGDELCSR